MTDDRHSGKSRLRRLDPKAWVGYLVGYQSTNIYRAWIPSLGKVISTRDIVFNEELVLDGKTENLIENLVHSNLEEIATWAKPVELPASQTEQPETETFYEDDTTEESGPSRRPRRSEKGKEVRGAYPSPPEIPPPVAFLIQTSQDNYETKPAGGYGTSTMTLWAAVFMVGTQSGPIGLHEGKSIDKAQLRKMLSKGIKSPQSQLPPQPPKAFVDLESHPLHDMFKEAERVHLKSHKQMQSWSEVPASQ